VDAIQNRQTRKRLATRQRISDVATRLFIERGFDQVTMDEIAEAADVSRMTVFNHFSRKEDLFFDLDEEGREDLVAALQKRNPGTPPVEALRLFAHWAVTNQRPYVRFFEEGSDKFMPDPVASLAASLLVATWTVALIEAHRAFQQGQNLQEANNAFLGLIDRGTKGVQSALEGTPYI
jgi:AcrR family transcriptional regulator